MRIGSVSTPIKRALMEMLKHGALRQQNGHVWKSCTGKSFRDHTIIAMASRNLAILSINKHCPGAQFARLNEIGTKLARAIMAEYLMRHEYFSNVAKAATITSPQITSGERPRATEVIVP